MNDPRIELERQLFYSELESGMYDSTIELVAPCYKQLHQALMDILTFHFGGGISHSDTLRQEVLDVPSGWVLDIGSGTGAESLALLRRFPRLNVVALDVAEPMHDIFRGSFARALPNERFEDRVATITADIRDFGDGQALIDLVPDKRKLSSTSYSIIMSAFAIHHLDSIDKESVYRISYEALDDGGLFANADLFTYQSTTFRKFAAEFDSSWITQQFDHPAPHFEASAAVSKERREVLKNKWLEHYREFNDLGPIESATTRETVSDRTAIKGQAEMLIDAGFREVACPYRYWQMGILCALK